MKIICHFYHKEIILFIFRKLSNRVKVYDSDTNGYIFVLLNPTVTNFENPNQEI